jgi:hypothetical protein
MKKNKQLIIEKYKNKTLAYPNFKSDYLLTTKDFMTMDSVISFFYDYSDHELDLTSDGYAFLDEYYGMDVIVSQLIDIKYIAGNLTGESLKSYIYHRLFDCCHGMKVG